MDYDLIKYKRAENIGYVHDQSIMGMLNIWRGRIYLDDHSCGEGMFVINLTTFLNDPIAKPMLEVALASGAGYELFFRQHRGTFEATSKFIRENEGSVLVYAPGSQYIAIICPPETIGRAREKTLTIWVKSMVNDYLWFRGPSIASK